MSRSNVVKRSVIIGGHRTSISVEDAFWDSLREIAHRMDSSMHDLVAEVDRHRPAGSNLSSAVRLFVLANVRPAAA